MSLAFFFASFKILKVVLVSLTTTIYEHFTSFSLGVVVISWKVSHAETWIFFKGAHVLKKEFILVSANEEHTIIHHHSFAPSTIWIFKFGFE